MSRQLHDDSADSGTFREGAFHNVDAGSQWSPLRKRGAGVIGRSLSAGRLPSPMAVKRHTDIACGARSRGCCADSSRTGLVRPILRAASGVSLADDAIANSKHPNPRGGWSRRARLRARGLSDLRAYSEQARYQPTGRFLDPLEKLGTCKAARPADRKCCSTAQARAAHSRRACASLHSFCRRASTTTIASAASTQPSANRKALG